MSIKSKNKKSQHAVEIFSKYSFYGALGGTFIKLFDTLYSELKQKEDVINSFVAQLRYGAKFDERLKERFLSENSYLADSQTIYK
jgi:hypothetical protein